MKNLEVDSPDRRNKFKHCSTVKSLMSPRDRQEIKVSRYNDLEGRWKEVETGGICHPCRTLRAIVVGTFF